ncbi:MAG TPA: M17 family peptidase N-terminal domain-containing protein, partial [Streptosporangiaceae bacterium]|nr:M17 family peptidase N-terminal domain-containing protein [Streptosporangiaceae bacterium]
MTTIKLDNAAPSALVADAIVIGIVSGESPPVLAPGAEDVDRAYGGRLVEALSALGATGEAGEVVKLPTLGALPAAVLVAAGLG